MNESKVKISDASDAILDTVARRLGRFERQYKLDSPTFFDKYTSGYMAENHDFKEWSNEYSHYMMLKIEFDRQLHGTS